MDYLLTTTLEDLTEINTLVISTSKERMEALYAELLNKYSVFSFYYGLLSIYEKSRIVEEIETYNQYKLSTLYEILKKYERKEDSTSSF